MPGVGVVRIQSQRLPLAPQSQRSENFSKRLQSPVCITFGIGPGAISLGGPAGHRDTAQKRGVSGGLELGRFRLSTKIRRNPNRGILVSGLEVC
jgi:hypothetical protein